MLPDLLPLKPYLREAIWGGRGLETHFNKPLPPNQHIGESWEVSAYADMESVVSAGPLAGQNLRGLAQLHGADLLGQPVVDRYGAEFPMLIKLLDARDDLSIQVHPDDTYARAEGLGTYGKMEAWYVLHSDNGRVAYGLQNGVGKAELEASIRENRVEETVQFFDVEPGDVVNVPPGTVHALCQNVMIYEVQQSSDLTFRIYDYNRPGTDGNPRDLHIDRSLDVITFGNHTPKPKRRNDLPSSGVLVESEHFCLERFCPQEANEHTYPSFAALTVIEGQAKLQGSTDPIIARKGETVFITANRKVTTAPQNGDLEYLISSVP